MNSVLYLTERLRQRALLAPLTGEQADLADATHALIEVQLACEALLRVDPNNAALRTLAQFMTRNTRQLEHNLQVHTTLFDDDGETA